MTNNLPSIGLPYDWYQILSDKQAGKLEEGVECWCNVNEPNKETVYDSIELKSKESNNLNFKKLSDIGVEWGNKYELNFNLGPNSNGIRVKSYKKLVETSMKSNNFSLSPQAELFAVGGDDGKLQIHSSENGEVLRVLEGHFGDINHTQFFPSGQVLLSSGSDFLIKIWSVLDGTNPVTLKGHTRGVTNTQIINRGWNVVSGSLDGTVKLWECGTGKVVRDFKLGQDSVNWVSLLDNSSEIDKYTQDVVSAGTSGHKLLSCNNNGSFTLLDLNNPKPILTHKQNSIPLNRGTFLTKSQSNPQFVTGDVEGNINLYDMRSPANLLYTAKKDDYAITSILEPNEASTIGSKLVVGHKDGSISDLIITSEGFQLTGQKFLNELYECINLDLDQNGNTWALDKRGQLYVF